MLSDIDRIQPITIPGDALNFMVRGQCTPYIIAHDIPVRQDRGTLFIGIEIRQPQPKTPRLELLGERQRAALRRRPGSGALRRVLPPRTRRVRTPAARRVRRRRWGALGSTFPRCQRKNAFWNSYPRRGSQQGTRDGGTASSGEHESQGPIDRLPTHFDVASADHDTAGWEGDRSSRLWTPVGRKRSGRDGQGTRPTVRKRC